jgi:hypothetical protein
MDLTLSSYRSDRDQTLADRRAALCPGDGQPTLVTGRSVRVNDALPRRTVEEAHGREALFGSGIWRLRLLERRTKRGPLGAIAHRGCASLSHVLLRGRDIRHVVSPEFLNRVSKIEPRTLPVLRTDVKATQLVGLLFVHGALRF